MADMIARAECSAPISRAVLQPGSSGLSPRVAELRDKLLDFMTRRIYPSEEIFEAHAASDDRWSLHPLMEDLKTEAKALGLWNLWLPTHLAASLEGLRSQVPQSERATLLGTGLNNLEYAHLCEVTGRSMWAPEAFNCSPPDTGNMEVLGKYGTPQQQKDWLLPLLRGKTRSCFGMTEKAVASADATNIQASIVRTGNSYVLNGVKWWTSGAMDPRCSLCIFMGKSDTSAVTHKQQSMVLVDMKSPGVRIIRPLQVFGFDDAPHGHAEVHFNNVSIPVTNMLLGEGRGFEIAQGRLGPGRLHHCMRLIGAGERGLQLMAERALTRTLFGGPLAKMGAFQSVLAERRIQLDAARLLVLSAADALDRAKGEVRLAIREIAQAKVAAPAAAAAALDASMQAHGGGGLSQDFPLTRLWSAARTLRLADGPDEVHLGTIAKMELARVSKGMSKL